MKKQLNNLLDRVNAISKKYIEIARLTGENFNVFNILNLSTAEVRTHSAFLKELLDPKGCHDQGGEFLELFIAYLKAKFQNNNEIDLLKLIKDFETSKANAYVEKNIGNISNDGKEGGQIDILITDLNNKAVIIENKINAGDQDKQLLRYSNYGNKNHNNKYILLYLTLYGKEASDWSTGNNNKSEETDSNINKEQEALYTKEYIKDIENSKDIKIINLSYKYDIITWLKDCKEKAVNHPYLRETIAQYINLIKYLTNQTINSKMEEEIVELLKKNVEAAFLIGENFHNLKADIMENSFITQMEKIAKNKNLSFSQKTEKYHEKNWGFHFYKEDWKHLKISFSFDKNDFGNFYYGISKQDENLNVPDETIKILSEYGGGTPNKWWAFWKYMDRYKYWDKEAFIAILSDKKEMKKEIEDKVDELLKISAGINM